MVHNGFKPLGRRVIRDHRVQQALQVHKDRQVLLAPMVQQVRQVRQVRKVPQALLALREFLGRWVRWVLKVQLVLTDYQEPRVLLAQQELTDCLELQVLLVRLVRQE
jgi:hypothetical protein